jgi:phage terminase large subunit
MQVKAEFPDKLRVLFQPARYKVLYGGRGGAKSWGIARALLVLAAGKPLRVLCAREIQKSISESVHQLLADQIRAMGLEGFYEILNNEIRGKNGSLFIFAGLKHNIQNIKSKEGVDIVWVEEAATVSKSSWDTLIPTIRKEGSEIWISFNPELDTDETYKRFVLNPPPGAVVVKVNWSDNPWFPDVLAAERDHLKATDEDAYLTVWEGHCKAVLDGAIFANEIRRATEANQFTRVPYDASKPVETFWDLGKRDKTAIWFVQQVGYEFRLIDYYENRGQILSHYVKVLRERPYVYGTTWLPHDAENDLLASERTIMQQVQAHNFDVRIVPKTSVADRIEAARAVFNRCFFDEEKTADGLQCLRRWRYDVDPDTNQYSRLPLHDDASHGADAFTYFAVSMEEAATPRKHEDHRSFEGAWMG